VTLQLARLAPKLCCMHKVLRRAKTHSACLSHAWHWRNKLSSQQWLVPTRTSRVLDTCWLQRVPRNRPRRALVNTQRLYEVDLTQSRCSVFIFKPMDFICGVRQASVLCIRVAGASTAISWPSATGASVDTSPCKQQKDKVRKRRFC
jgi:hypothetical protein